MAKLKASNLREVLSELPVDESFRAHAEEDIAQGNLYEASLTLFGVALVFYFHDEQKLSSLRRRLGISDTVAKRLENAAAPPGIKMEDDAVGTALWQFTRNQRSHFAGLPPEVKNALRDGITLLFEHLMGTLAIALLAPEPSKYFIRLMPLIEKMREEIRGEIAKDFDAMRGAQKGTDTKH